MRLGAAATLLLAAASACSKSSNSATAVPTAVPSGATASPTTTPTPAVIGVAYVPDGGNGAGFNGIQFAHFEDTGGNLLPSPATSATPTAVRFPASVGPLAFAADGSVAAAAMGSAGVYTQIQGIFGANAANLVPAGLPYVTNVPPSPAASPTPTATPEADAVVADVRSISILGTSTAAVALLQGNPAGLLGVSSLTQTPPQFSGFVPFSAAAVATPSPIPLPAGAAHLFVASEATSTGGTDGNGNAIVGNALVRGNADLFSLQVTVVGAGYGFAIKADDTTLGVNPAVAANQRGRGAMAFSPTDPSRALIGQAPAANQVTLVTGLPTAITRSYTLTLPTGARIRSVAIATGGQMAVLGADDGYYVIGGVSSPPMTLLAQTSPGIYGTGTVTGGIQPSYVGADGATHALANISSVGFSADGKYLALLGSATGATSATLVALPFNQSIGASATPAPSGTIPPQTFTQNNVYLPNADQDLTVVR